MGRARNPDNDAFYLLNLCDEILRIKASREHRFDWLRGDLSPRTGRTMTLPVDGYWEPLKLVVEVMESQHYVPTPHFDKPEKITVSGVHRGLQRRLYDERKAELIPLHGLTFIALPITSFEVRGKKIKRQPELDTKVVREVLSAAGVLG
jgi:hypothetical protein